MAIKSPEKKSAQPSGSNGTSKSVFKQLIVASVMLVLLFAVYQFNARQDQLPQLIQEFNQLQQNPNPSAQLRLQELYNEIISIQNDTSLLKRITKGYRWAIHDMGFGSLEQIREMENQLQSGRIKSLSLEDKKAFKIATYPYLKYLVANTPENAVILLPPYAQIGEKSQYNFLSSSEWVEYFIYPRMCISEDAKDHYPEVYAKVTHVAVVDSWGYEKIPYPTGSYAREAVFPIKPKP